MYAQEIMEYTLFKDLNAKQTKVGTEPEKCKLCVLGKIIKAFNF